MGSSKIKKTDLILLLLHSDKKLPIDGITRFEKLLFLSQKEILDKWSDIQMKFNFEADRFGPLATELYDEIDFLKSVGMIRKEPENKYVLTEKGQRFIETKVLQRVHEKLVIAIESLKKEHNNEKLDDLLKYVYSTYPDYTIKSEIRDKVLR